MIRPVDSAARRHALTREMRSTSEETRSRLRRGSVMHTVTMQDELEQLAALLDSQEAGAAYRLRCLSLLQARGEDRFWVEVNANEIWGGAGSLADQAFVVNPGVPPEVWQVQRRKFHELMIRLGRALLAHGNANPRISMWVEAFEQWNRLDI